MCTVARRTAIVVVVVAGVGGCVGVAVVVVEGAVVVAECVGVGVVFSVFRPVLVLVLVEVGLAGIQLLLLLSLWLSPLLVVEAASLVEVRGVRPQVHLKPLPEWCGLRLVFSVHLC